VADSGSDLLDNIDWIDGPCNADINGIAEIRVPGGYTFANAKDTKSLMELMENPISGNEVGFIAPATLDWFCVFEFDDCGYVKDDEKNNLDADLILESLIEANQLANEERKKRGWQIITITGWKQSPYYNEETHNLEWAINGKSNEEYIINNNVRILGRKGVMTVTMVTNDLMKFDEQIVICRSVLEDFSFKSGYRYEQFLPGDKIAEYGLTGLIAGGAVAVAAKSGIFKWLWKLIVAAVIAISAFFRKIFRRRDDT
jgi:uncharacterized membrane-anchored protein